MHRIHIVGVNPRTGTTLLAECMRASFEIAHTAGHEEGLFKLRACHGVSLTKTPHDVDYVGLRLALDPHFYVICMVRDPRDVAVSMHGERPGEYWPYTSLARFRERLALAWRHARNPRFMIIKFEDLVAEPDVVQLRIRERLPFLAVRGRFSNFHTAGAVSMASSLALNGVRPIDASNQSKWTAHIGRLREMIARDGPIDAQLVELGYETDQLWMVKYEIPKGPGARPPRQGWMMWRLRRRLLSAISAVIAATCTRLHIDVG